MEDVREDFLLADAKVHVVVVRMRADVNDAVHVEIEIVENGNLKKRLEFRRAGDALRRRRT